MLPIRRSVPRPLRLLSGHLGSTVSALVDGQLDDEAAERAWQHVLHCPPCRRLVEHEGWVKRQLAQIADAPRADEPSDRFLGSLLDLDPAAVAWAETQEIEDRGRTRRRAVRGYGRRCRRSSKSPKRHRTRRCRDRTVRSCWRKVRPKGAQRTKPGRGAGLNRRG